MNIILFYYKKSTVETTVNFKLVKVKKNLDVLIIIGKIFNSHNFILK